MLENARSSVVIVLGKSKHPALERIWAANGDLDETPGRVIRSFRGSICWVIDRRRRRDGLTTDRSGGQAFGSDLAASMTCSAVMPSSFITVPPGAEMPKRSIPRVTPSRPT